MFCEKCGNQILDTERFCGTCGWQVPAKEETSVENVGMQQEEIAPAVPEAVPGAIPAEIPQTGVKKKSSKKLPIIFGAAAVLLILAVVLVMFLSGWFKRNFSSPEKYFQYVAKESVKEYSANAASSYEDMLNWIDFVGKNVSFEAEWVLHEDLIDLMSMDADTDMSFLESGSVAANYSIGKEMMGADVSISFNGVEIGTIDIIVDFLEDNMYISVPDFMKKYLGADMEEMGSEIDEDMFEDIEKMMEFFPESKTLESLMNRYYGVMIDCINDVEKEKDTIKVEGVSQDVTAFTVTIDEDTLCDMGEAVFEEMLKDKEMQSLIMDMAEVMGEDPDDMYDEFVESIEDAMDDVEDSVYLEEDIEFIVFVNSSDEICGFEMEFEDVAMTYVMAKSGGKFGFEASMESYGDEIAFVGSGKESGDKLTGDFSFEVDGASYLDIAVKDFDTEKAAKGYLSGEFTISVPSRMANLLEDEMGSGVDMEDCALKIVAEASSTSSEVQIELSEGKDVLIGATVALSIGDQDSIKAPADKNVAWADDEEALLEVIMNFDWKELLNRLEDVDLPSEITDELEYLIDELEYLSEFY